MASKAKSDLPAIKAKIALIDRKIDGTRMELCRRVGRFNMFSAHGWQTAWDRHPDLYGRNQALFAERDIAAQERDALIEAEYRAAKRRERASYRRAA